MDKTETVGTASGTNCQRVKLEIANIYIYMCVYPILANQCLLEGMRKKSNDSLLEDSLGIIV